VVAYIAIPQTSCLKAGSDLDRFRELHLFAMSVLLAIVLYQSLLANQFSVKYKQSDIEYFSIKLGNASQAKSNLNVEKVVLLVPHHESLFPHDNL